MIEQFINIEDRKKEKKERAHFIATLDEALITSPNSSPKPKSQLGHYAQQMSMTNKVNDKGLASEQPRATHTTILDKNPVPVKGQNQSFTCKSFGSKQSDALQT